METEILISSKENFVNCVYEMLSCTQVKANKQ